MHLPVVVSKLPFSFLNKEGCDDIKLILRANQIFLFTCARFKLLLSLVLDMTASRFIVRSLNQLSLCTLSLLFSLPTNISFGVEEMTISRIYYYYFYSNGNNNGNHNNDTLISVYSK